MQRTNISRDIKEDLELNRIYLPKTKRKFKGEKKKILENKFLRLSLSHDLKVFLHETDQYYLNSWEGIKKLPFKYSLSVAIAAELYPRIGLKIETYFYALFVVLIFCPGIYTAFKNILPSELSSEV